MRPPKYHPLSIKDQLVARYTVEFFAPFEFLNRLQNCFSLGMSVAIKEHRGAAHILVCSLIGCGFPCAGMMSAYRVKLMTGFSVNEMVSWVLNIRQVLKPPGNIRGIISRPIFKTGPCIIIYGVAGITGCAMRKRQNRPVAFTY